MVLGEQPKPLTLISTGTGSTITPSTMLPRGTVADGARVTDSAPKSDFRLGGREKNGQAHLLSTLQIFKKYRINHSK